MERTFLEEWNVKFGVNPPEWVSHFNTTKHQQYMLDDVDREIGKREANIDQLELELQQERFLLDWLCATKRKLQGEVERSRSSENCEKNLMNGDSSSPKHSQKSEHTLFDVTPDTREDPTNFESLKDSTDLEHSPTHTDRTLSSNSKSPLNSTPDSTECHTAEQTSSCDTLDTNISETFLRFSPVALRERFCHLVDKSDACVARAVSRRLIEQGRHWSCQFLDSQTPEDDTFSSPSIGSDSPAFVRRSASDPTPQLSKNSSKSSKQRYASSIETPAGKILTPEQLKEKSELFQELLVQESEIQPCPENKSEPSNVDMLTDNESKPSESESVSIVGKRNSNGIILDSLDTNKILALEEDDEDNNEQLLSSMGSRAQRTRTPRSSLDQSRIKIVRLSNGDMDGSPSHIYSHEDKENTRAKDTETRYQRPKNSLEQSASYRHSMNLEEDECMTPKGDLSMSLTPDSIDTLSSSNTGENEKMAVERMTSLEDPTVTITRERASLLKERQYEVGRKETLTEESAKRMVALMNDLEAVTEEDKPKSYPDATLTRDTTLSNPESENSETAQIPFSRLDSLSEELQKALSQINSTPEMSIATLLDIDENTEMNEQLQASGSEHSSLEDLESFEGDVDEATISVYTLRNDIFGSATSIPSLFTGNDSFSSSCSSPPDQFTSPNHSTVNLRHPSGSKSKLMKRRGNAGLDCMGTASSDSDSSPSHVPQFSRTESGDSVIPITRFSLEDYSEPQVSPPNSPLERSSRIFQGVQVKRSTVVVHGEQLVIRKLVVAGIVSAEKTYMDCLTAMREYYKKPLLARATTSQPILSERDINTIFYCVEDLCTLHSTLHDQLEPTLAKWSIKTCVGEFFVHLCRNLKLYKDYVEMYRKSVECLRKHKQENPQFKTFVEDVHATVSAHFKDIPRVNELIRRPVERLQSYSLVLNDLCQHTPEDHPDYRILRESLQVMTAFIASTHDPHSFKHLSGGFNRELVKDGLVVEISDGIRKIRRLFLFHDVLVCSKQKPSRGGVKFEAKWYLPLNEISFKPPEDSADPHRPVPVTSDVELSVMKNKIAEIKAQLSKEGGRDRMSSVSSEKEDKSSFKRNLKAQIQGFKGKHVEKYRKKLEEQEVSYWVASPSLPLRLYGRAGKQYMFVLHTEEERERWVSAIKKLQPKVVTGVYLSSYELQDLLGRQMSKDLRKLEDMIIPKIDEEYLYGVLKVRVTGASDLKAKSAGVYCVLELDEYGKFERKARTQPTGTDDPTLLTSWDQDFEIELTGAHMLKIQICTKSLLKEETHANGKIRLPIKDLKQSKRQKVEIKLVPQGSISMILEYYNNLAAMARKPSLLSSGVFGVPIDIVAKRERHDIPLIVQTCIDEIERRGMSEVGIYRVAGVLRDVQELRQAFDTDYLRAQMIAFEADIHAVAGLLKRYFRELPDPLFTNELYQSFVQGLGLSDPDARAQCLLSLLHSLPPINFKTAVFLFKHLRRVAANSAENKMSLNNLSTVFGPNLLSPGNMLQMDVVTPVSVVLFFLNCPEEFFDESLFGQSELSSSTSSSNKSRNTGGRGSFPKAEKPERKDSNGASSLAVKRTSVDELDSPHTSSPSRGGIRRSRRGSNRLLNAIKSDSKLPSGKESVI